jgi:hypothetical protein
VGLERVPLSLVSTIEELLERKSSGSGLDKRDYRRRDPARRRRFTSLSTKVGTNFADKRWSSVGIVLSRTQVTEFVSDWINLAQNKDSLIFFCKYGNDLSSYIKLFVNSLSCSATGNFSRGGRSVSESLGLLVCFFIARAYCSLVGMLMAWFHNFF